MEAATEKRSGPGACVGELGGGNECTGLAIKGTGLCPDHTPCHGDLPSGEQVMLRHLRFVIRHSDDRVMAISHFHGEASFSDALMMALQPYSGWLKSVMGLGGPRGGVDEILSIPDEESQTVKASMEIAGDKYFGKRLEVHELEMVDGEPYCRHRNNEKATLTDMCLT